MNPVRILGFNIHGGYDLRRKRDLSRVHKLMEKFNIDIGIIQEMDTRPSRGGTANDVEILAGPERPHHLKGPTLTEGEGWYGNLIVSRYPISRALVHDLETKPVLEPRNAVDALINTPYGNMRMIGTHLSLSSIVRWGEINNLIKLVDEVEDEAKYPFFFIGDFNEWFLSSKLVKHLNKLMRPLPCGKTFPSFRPLFRLDRVWCDDHGISATAKVLRGADVRSLSDHLPVLIEVGGVD